MATTPLAEYKQQFVDFMLRCDVLRFGDFTTKSGRKTPYFINTGLYDSGERIQSLGDYYAQAIMERLDGEFDLLYGPAYKGIPLVVSVASALYRRYNLDIGITFNRKQAKDHGEGGMLIGRKPQDGDRIVIIDDVITAGTSVDESAVILKDAADIDISAVIVSVDRQEKGKGDRSALVELAERYGADIFAIVTLDEILLHLDSSEVMTDDLRQRISEYRAAYGVSA